LVDERVRRPTVAAGARASSTAVATFAAFAAFSHAAACGATVSTVLARTACSAVASFASGTARPSKQRAAVQDDATVPIQHGD
jgi:hypothetical protein